MQNVCEVRVILLAIGVCFERSGELLLLDGQVFQSIYEVY